ncbi:hypothetical protein XENTR_v10024711 [Xenopus tropicalis]|nr:hypothetical protein XENTR_v10024711 [Xenopus tropicalis]
MFVFKTCIICPAQYLLRSPPRDVTIVEAVNCPVGGTRRYSGAQWGTDTCNIFFMKNWYWQCLEDRSGLGFKIVPGISSAESPK